MDRTTQKTVGGYRLMFSGAQHLKNANRAGRHAGALFEYKQKTAEYKGLRSRNKPTP